MKKTLIAAVVAISLLLVISCKSTTGEVNDDAFNKIYNKYKSGLILDGAKKYTVKSGDNLVNISRSFYNNGFYYPVIMLASSDVVKDPDKIQVGMELTIPDLQKNLDNQVSKTSIKGVIFDCAGIEDNRDRKETAKGLRDRANNL